MEMKRPMDLWPNRWSALESWSSPNLWKVQLAPRCSSSHHDSILETQQAGSPKILGCGMILKPRMIRLILKPKPMIPKPRMILKPKKMVLKPRMIPKPRTTGNQGSSKKVICKNVVVPPHPTPPHPAFGDDAMQSVAARILVAEWCGFWLLNRAEFG